MKKLMALLLITMITLMSSAGCGSKTGSGSQQENNKSNVSWPTGDVKLITTVAVGGNMDIKARIVSKYLAKELGVNVIVENLPGGGGVTGMTKYLSEKPNTHSIMYMGVPHLTTAPFFNEVQYKSGDISIICGLDTVENGLFISSKNKKFKDFKGLLEYGKAGNTIKFGSAGMNNDTFLFTKVLFEKAGVKSDSVDSNSSAESLVNCVAGNVDVAYSAMNLAAGYIEKGDLIPIGVFSANDFKGYKNITVPSFKSMGNDITYSATSFFAIRSGTDKAVLDKLENALNKVCENKEFQSEFAKAGYVLMENRSKESITEEISKIQNNLKSFESLFKK